jgi:hypothetical protein
MNKKTILMIAGFTIFFFGFIALVLSLVGLQLSMLTFIDIPGRTFGLVVRLIMIFGGMIMLYLGRVES